MNADLIEVTRNLVGHRNVQNTDVPTVVSVRGGWFSSLFGKFEKNKSALLTVFQRRYACAYLWLDDWNADLVSEVNGKWEVSGENLFCVPQGQDFEILHKKLYLGKWQLFFSEQPLQQKSIEYAKGAGELERLLVRSGARIVVVSWFDDTEWFVGWQP
jgi:hypothetical protein